MSPRELLRQLTAELSAAGVPDPDIDASLLLAHVTGQNAMNLRLDSWSQVLASDEEAVRRLCQARKTRTPLQYLTHEQSFMGRIFYVDERVLIPRPETELLTERGIAALAGYTAPSLLDLCCGSGAIGISAALACPGAQVHSADLSEGALAVTRRNAQTLGADITLHQGDLFAAVGDLRFAVIVSNPPYIPTSDCRELQAEVLQEPHMALDGGTDGYDFYRRIAENAPAHLLPGGTLLLEVGYDQAEQVMALLRQAGFENVQAHEDYQHIQRMVEARLPCLTNSD